MGGKSMKKGKGIGKETLDEGEWEEMLIRVGDLLKGIRALDEIDLNEVSPAFSYNPEGGRNGED
jgi:hypothetical protein